jgi:peptidyl-prolyl cis-trans isomerase A (cyclophilin A)
MIHRRHALALLAAPLAAQETGKPIVVAIETALGRIVVALRPDRAPKTVANFLRYVEAGLYKGGVFHRTVTLDNQPQSPVKIEVIQGGPIPDKQDRFPPVALERTSVTGLHHVDGAISMARFEPDSAVGDFFFCIGDQPELDFGGKRNPDGQGFAAFGLAIEGLNVIRRIQRSPADGQRLQPAILIEDVRRFG